MVISGKTFPSPKIIETPVMPTHWVLEQVLFTPDVLILNPLALNVSHMNMKRSG